MIENGSRSEGIPGVFQVTRVVLYAKAALTGVMGSAPFGYSKDLFFPKFKKSSFEKLLLSGCSHHAPGGNGT